MAEDMSALTGSVELKQDEEAQSRAVQVLQINLARETVQDMRKAAKAGKLLHLEFGKQPVLRYGQMTKPLRARRTRFPEEIYSYTEGASDHIAAAGTEYAMRFTGLVSHHVVMNAPHEASPSSSVPTDAVLKMKQQYAAISQEKQANQITIRNEAVNPLKAKRQKARSKPSYDSQRSLGSNTTNRAIHTSLLSVQSATSGPAPTTAASRAQRFSLIHLLALGPLAPSIIQRKTSIPSDALAKHLDSVAERTRTDSEAVCSLATKRYRDLDPWNFPYTTEERAQVIDKAVHAFDKLRIHSQDKLWQVLLSPSERGRGKTLSKLNQFPNDHRDLLAGLNTQNKSRPASPAFTTNADTSEPESMNSTRKHTKKPDLIANAKKRQAGKSSIDKPAKQEKPMEKTKTEPKKAGNSAATVDSNKKRKIKSDERVHLSDDESLASDAKSRDLGSARKTASQSQSSTTAKKGTDDQSPASKKVKTSHVSSKQETSVNGSSSQVMRTKPTSSADASNAASKPAATATIHDSTEAQRRIDSSSSNGNADRVRTAQPANSVSSKQALNRPGASKGPKEEAKATKAQPKPTENAEKKPASPRPIDTTRASMAAGDSGKINRVIAGTAKRAAEPTSDDTAKEAKRQKLTPPNAASSLDSVNSSAKSSKPLSSTASIKKTTVAPANDTKLVAKSATQPTASAKSSAKSTSDDSSKGRGRAINRASVVKDAARPDSSDSNSGLKSKSTVTGTKVGEKTLQTATSVKQAAQSSTNQPSDKSAAASTSISKRTSLEPRSHDKNNVQSAKPREVTRTATNPDTSTPKASVSSTSDTVNSRQVASSGKTSSQSTKAEKPLSSQPAAVAAAKSASKPSASASPNSLAPNGKVRSVATTKSERDPEDTTREPLSRRQTFEAYKKYHAYFNAYNEHYENVKAKSPDEVTDTDIGQLETQNGVLIERREPIVAGLKAIIDKAKIELSTLPDRAVSSTNELSNLTTEEKADEAKEKLKVKFRTWTARYEDLKNNLGTCKPNDFDALVEQLDDIVTEQCRIASAIVLEYGKKSKGNLNDVTMSVEKRAK